MASTHPDGKPTAMLEHRSSGRIRVRLPRGERSPEQMEQIRERLSRHPDVDSVAANPATGSILVTGGRSSPLRSALAEFLTVVESVEQEGAREAGVEATVDLVKKADEKLRHATSGRFSLRALIPALLVSFGIRELLREGLTIGTVPWYVLIYYGVDSFLKLYPQYAPRPQDTVRLT
jgi:hypothetical protein